MYFIEREPKPTRTRRRFHPIFVSVIVYKVIYIFFCFFFPRGVTRPNKRHYDHEGKKKKCMYVKLSVEHVAPITFFSLLLLKRRRRRRSWGSCFCCHDRGTAPHSRRRRARSRERFRSPSIRLEGIARASTEAPSLERPSRP